MNMTDSATMLRAEELLDKVDVITNYAILLGRVNVTNEILPSRGGLKKPLYKTSVKFDTTSFQLPLTFYKEVSDMNIKDVYTRVNSYSVSTGSWIVLSGFKKYNPTQGGIYLGKTIQSYNPSEEWEKQVDEYYSMILDQLD